MTWHRRLYVGALTLIVGFVPSACSLSDLVKGTDLPPEQQDPKVVKTREGAIEAYKAALVAIADAVAGTLPTPPAMDSYAYVTGVLSDELRSANIDFDFPVQPDQLIDSRNMRDGSAYTYSMLHQIRHTAIEARGALRKYAPDITPVYIGHMFALEGMANVMLAELFCSGIPLSAPQFEGNYTLTSGFSTQAVLESAIALFDSAAVYATDSTHIMNMIHVGRGRAFLSLGEYSKAGQAVASVPSGFAYTLAYSASQPKMVPKAGIVVVANQEGINGLPFASVDDPRVQSATLRDATAPFTLASAVEARLIEAENALHAGQNDWLSKVNAIRTTCTDVANCPSPAPAGTGGVSGLAPLTDPALDPLPSGKTIGDVRVDLLFKERAYWLFLTGHRLGDLRRLVRVYQRDQRTVYPVGAWGSRQIAPYGSDINMPVPEQERRTNSYYSGCLNRND